MLSVEGPTKSALKAMLVNLDSDEAMPSIQLGSVSPPAHGTSSSMVDIHIPDGKFEHFTSLPLFMHDGLQFMLSLL